MLVELRIASLGVIGDATVEFGPGFTAVTGETGAGKTMIVTGVGLLLGARAESRMIRHGAQRALVEGRLTPDAALADAVVERGGELDGGEVIVGRALTPSRSRATLGGVQLPVPVLTGLLGERLTIHGQSEQVRLAGSTRQREVLDAHAGPGLATLLEAYAADWARHRAELAELASLMAASQARARELAMLEFGLDEVAKADPQPGEDAALRAEASRLQAVDDLRLAARGALVALAGDDDAVDDAPQAIGLLAAARRSLEQAADSDPEAAGLASRVAEAGYLVADVSASLASYLASLDADPARLEAIAARLSELQSLTRKYGPTVDDVLAWAADAAVQAAGLASGDERIDELQQSTRQLVAALQRRAAEMGDLRRAAASDLAGRVRHELAALAMPRAELEFRVTPLAEIGPHGGDHVEIWFSANPGAAASPLGSVASGGELSRVRLALEVVLAEGSADHTFIFDEVDAGVGGSVALEIGRRLARLARHGQVIVVTHLAQVAAFADRHYVVEKADDGRVTTSGVREVVDADRVDELARMMAGLESSDSARAHAAELLAAAGGEAGV